MNNMVRLIGKIHIHPLLWVVVGLSVATAHFFQLILFLFIIAIHELGHALAASFFSWRIRRISILPFGGVAEMDEHGNRPVKEDTIVTLAGPLQHIWLIGAAFIVKELGLISESIYSMFLQYNFMVLFFNLIPIWPLDGGKLVYIVCSLKLPFSQALNKTLLISAVAMAFFIIAVLLSEPLNFNIWVVTSFLLFSLYYEWKQSRYTFVRFLLERYYGRNYDFRKLKPIVVKEDDLIIEVLEQFQRGFKHPIIIEKNGKEKGSLDENEVLHAYFSEKLTTAKMGDLLYHY